MIILWNILMQFFLNSWTLKNKLSKKSFTPTKKEIQSYIVAYNNLKHLTKVEPSISNQRPITNL